MSDRTELIDRYIAIWNEADAGRRRALIARTWTEQASYRDPLMQGDGQAGIDAMIAAAQQRFPAHRFRRAGAVDGFADRVRFCWELAAGDGEAIVAGTDFAQVAADDRLQAVTGFIDRMPG